MFRLAYYEGEKLIVRYFKTQCKCFEYIYDHELTEYWIDGVYYANI